MNIVYTACAVAIGGFIGGMGRWVLARTPGGHPGTLTANVAACAILGMVSGWSSLLYAAFGLGLAGALSTWSTLAKELGELAKARDWKEFLRYLFWTLLLSLGAAAWTAIWMR